jgi:hypothetical protein
MISASSCNWQITPEPKNVGTGFECKTHAAGAAALKCAAAAPTTLAPGAMVQQVQIAFAAPLHLICHV